ncbi:MAG: AfsR/SARP family transcriptional regulator, partial [Pseudonocardiaceae bacterium]
HRHPGSAQVGHTQGDQLCGVIGSLLTGNVRAAGAPLRKLLEDPDSDGPLALAGRLVQAVIDLVSGAAEGGSTEWLTTDAERIGALWLARQARVVCALRRGDTEEIQRVVADCDGVGDAWGALLARGAHALCQLLAGEPSQAAWHEVLVSCRTLDAGSLEAWALVFTALAAAARREPEAAALARHAESFSRTAGVWGAQALTALALAVTDFAVTDFAATAPRSHAGQLQQARSLAETHGLPWPEALAARLFSSTSPVVVAAAPAPVRLRCLGGFAFEVLGRNLDWGTVRPRAATMLRLLAIHMPLPVHRESLLQLWPDLPTDRAVRSMQVAVSSLRALLAPGASAGSFGTVARHGDTYVLVLPPGSEADVVEFAAHIQLATRARRARDAAAERAALADAVAVYRGELLPEDGPAEWVIDVRERLRQHAATATGRLAELSLADGDSPSAIEAARRSVDIDPFRDASWRVLIAACTQAGEPAAAARAKRDYAEVLSTLDIPQPPVNPAIPTPRSRSVASVRTR